jgi:isohexenylglutaconyl-CoA hydratase
VMGGGFGLACVVDVALAADDVSFRLPETSLGVIPAQIAPFLMERLGYSQAKRLAVTGGRLDAQQALAIGLVHEVHAAAGIDGALSRVLGDILQCAPNAISSTKALLAQGRFAAPASMVGTAAAAFSRAARGPEGLEGMAAFVARRKPSWVPPT